MKQKTLILALVFFSNIALAQKTTVKKQDWIANKNFEELKTYVSNITDSQKNLIYQVSYTMTNMFDSIKKLSLDPLEKRGANKSVFVYRKNEFKKILNTQQFDEFIMMEEEKLQEWRNKQKENIKDTQNPITN